MTLVARQPWYRDGIPLLYPGDEVAPGVLTKDEIDQMLDSGVLVEVPTRISYFALLFGFAGDGNRSRSPVERLYPELTIPPQIERTPVP